jgi:hypothetical protein
MFQGMVAVGLAWLAWAAFVFLPGDIGVPLWSPAFLLAAILGGLQAILWLPFGLPYVRLVAALVVSFGLLFGAATAWVHGVSDLVVAGLLACFLPPAYLVARAGVSRARRGDVPVWWRLQPRSQVQAGTSPRWQPFASPRGAQFWYEWRLHGLVFPLMLGCVLTASTGGALLLAPLAGDTAGGGLFAYLAFFTPETRAVFLVFHPLAILPPVLAAGMGSFLGGLGPGFRPSAFLLTRPLDSGTLVRAKLWTAARCTLAAAVLLLLAAVSWLLITGTGTTVAAWWQQVLNTYPPAEAWAMPLLAVVGLVGLVWLQLSKGIVIGLLGRFGAYCIPLLGVCSLMTVVLSCQWLLRHPEDRTGFWAVLPWLLGAVVLLKLLAAGWAFVRVQRAGHWHGSTLAAVVGAWILTAGSLLVLLWLLIPADQVPSYLLAPGVVACLPLARILAAPLVLEWSWHR